MSKYALRRLAALVASLPAFAFVLFLVMPLTVHGQGNFPWVYPFAGVQPQNSIDFSNPPITIKPQGGQVGSTNAIENVPIGSVAYGSFGNATTYAASGDVYITSIFVPYDMTVTNINVLVGGTIGTNTIIGSLYNAAGTVIGTSTLSGTVTANANTFNTLALLTPIAIQGPGVYYVGIQANGTTDNVRTIAASTFIGRYAKVVTGTFGIIPNINVPVLFTANTGPIVYLN